MQIMNFFKMYKLLHFEKGDYVMFFSALKILQYKVLYIKKGKQ